MHRAILSRASHGQSVSKLKGGFAGEKLRPPRRMTLASDCENPAVLRRVSYSVEVAASAVSVALFVLD